MDNEIMGNRLDELPPFPAPPSTTVPMRFVWIGPQVPCLPEADVADCLTDDTGPIDPCPSAPFRELNVQLIHVGRILPGISETLEG